MTDEKKLLKFVCILLGQLLSNSAGLIAADLPYGVDGSLMLTEASPLSTNSFALLGNPANIQHKGYRFFPQIYTSLISWEYRYKSADAEYKEVKKKINSTNSGVGASYWMNDNLAFSGVFSEVPLNYQNNFTNVPLESVDSVSTLAQDISIKSSKFVVSFGLTHRISDFFQWGVSYTQFNETKEWESVDSLTGVSLFKANWGGRFNQYTLGVRGFLKEYGTTISLAYKTLVKKNFAGQYVDETSTTTSAQKINNNGIEPAEILFSTSYSNSAIDLSLNMEKKYYSSGKNWVTSPIDSNAAGTDFTDVTKLGLSTSINFWTINKIYFAYMNITSYVGDGEKSAAFGDNSSGYSGVQFMDVNAIARQVFSLGYKLKLRKLGFVQGGLQHMRGKRQVPAKAQNGGDYGVEAFALVLGIARQVDDLVRN